MRMTVATAVACFFSIGISTAHDAQAAIKQDTTIAAQGLGSALKQLANERDIQLVYRSDVVGERQTSGTVGELTFDEALTNLLKGTGLTFRYLDDRAVTIVPMASDASSRHDSEGRAANSQDSSRSVGIEEVIVTARKRAERIQDVPISIAAITADDIDRRGLISSEDYLRGIAGVSQSEGGALGQTIVIRGLESQTFLQNQSAGGATVATYFGETPTTYSAGITGGSSIDIKLVDIDRVEVLRGPQGTAFGGAAMGGVVRAIPSAPKLDRAEAKLAAGYSVTEDTGGNNYSFQGSGNLPLIRDTLAIRAVAYRFTESGFYRNRAGSNPAYQEAIAPFGADAFAVDEDEVGGSTVTGGRVAAMFQAGDSLQVTLSYLNQRRETDGFAGATSGYYEQTVQQVAPEDRRRGEFGMLYDEDIAIANAVVEYDFSWASLLATFSNTDSGSAGPHSYTIYPCCAPLPWSSNLASDHRANVGEIRLSTHLAGPWNFLAGLYIEDLEDKGREQNTWYGDLEANVFAPGEPDLGGFDERRSMKQTAAFGEISWELIPNWTLTGGFRTYEYERSVLFDAEGPLYGSIHNQNQADASGTNFRANLSYSPSETTLLYGGWSQGFRFGRVQQAPPASACDVDGDGLVDGTNVVLESLTRINSDDVDNYEVGGKFTLLERRLLLTADVFRMNWNGMPLNALPTLTPACQFAVTGTGAGTLANVGTARSDGVEVQANFQATDAFRIDLGGSYIRAKLTDAGPAFIDAVGHRLPGAPEVNANLGLQYDFGNSGLMPSVRVDATYADYFYSSLQSTPLDKAGGYLKLDLSVRVSIRDTNVDLFLRNITNEDVYTSKYSGSEDPDFGTRMRPRTVGLQVSHDF